MPSPLLICMFLYLINQVQPYLDLYIPEDDVLKLFGVENSQLYYIHDGEVNQYALNFIAVVQPEQSILQYKWKANLETQIIYDINITETNDASEFKLSKKKLIKSPYFSIDKNGIVPDTVNIFEVYVNCTGSYEGNVTIATELIFHLSLDGVSKSFNISIKRLKKCVKNKDRPKKDEIIKKENYSDDKDKAQKDEIITKENYPEESTKSPSPSDNTIEENTSAFYLPFTAVAILIAIVCFGFCWWNVRLCRKEKRQRPDGVHRMHISQYGGNQFLRLDLPNNTQRAPSHSSFVQFTPLINDLGKDIKEIREKLSDISISRDRVSMNELVLKGTFARFYKGMLEDSETFVLIKTVTDAATEEQKRLLLFESCLLRGIHHRNLLTIKHVVLDNDNDVPMVLFPFKEGSNLKHFLQSLKGNDNLSSAVGLFSSNVAKFDQLSTQQLVEVAIQVACGMAYLAKRGIVHKDVATRNCVVDNDLKVKITDYALSRDAFPSDYCCLGDYENRPVRWLSLESLVHKIYTSASDVWSFGILLWELQSLASTPYIEIDDFEMEDYLSDGFRLSQPINCPDHLYSIMAGCWHYSADQRPSFSQLLHLLTEFYAELSDYI